MSNRATIEAGAANDYLPLPEEQQWLLEELAGLVSACGVGPLVRSHILLPTVEYFPDKWTPDARGVRRLCQRLLLYAGLGQLRVQIVTYTNPTESMLGPALGGYSTQHRTEGAAGWFGGIQDGCCMFGVDTNQLEESAAVVGTMCHEVAHAFRAHHQLVHTDSKVEELLTDLTTVFLGFGVLTANSAYLHRSDGGVDGEAGVYRVRTSQSGYLLPEAMCFLLAAQAIVRQLPGTELRQIHRALETNQESYFKAAFKALAGDPAGLAQRLKVPELAQWPPTIRLGKLTRPLADPKEPKGRYLPNLQPTLQRNNAGTPVFKVRNRRADFRLVVLLVVFGGAALLTGGIHGVVFGSIVALVGLAHWLTIRRRLSLCSEPECQAHIPEGYLACPGCRGRVAGEIRFASQRLDAREAFLAGKEDPDLPAGWDEPLTTPEADTSSEATSSVGLKTPGE